jgi:phenylacetate-CoA ligase
MTERRYYDKLETRDPEERERALMATLPQQVAHARRAAAYFAERLRDIEPRGVTSRKALASLPVTRKSQLIQLQRKHLPFGGLNAVNPDQLQRVFMSPGPIYDPEGRRADYWRMARPLFAAGFRAGELIHNCFSYHLTPAGVMVESGAQALGCPVFPGGTGQTELQVKAITDLQPRGYTGTPSFLRLILEKARELGVDISCLKRALVGGEAFTPALRSVMVSYQIAAFQTYGTADCGNIAYETEARDGLVLDESIILEIVRPGTGDPVPEGEVGEVVVTTLTADYPLVRFATGDLSSVLPGLSPCGRTNQRISGWLGRAEQTAKVKGIFVHPEQVADVAKRHKEVSRARLVVTHDGHSDIMTLKAEVAAGTDPGLALKLAESLAAVTKLTGQVALVPPRSLPNDGKVIEDARRLA